MTTEVYGSQAFINALFDSGAVGFNWGKLIRFKSGILSPGAYINNRVLQSHPNEWRIIVKEMAEIITRDEGFCDVLAAVATGGIPHGAAVAYEIGMPMVTIKKEEKTTHGLAGLIDGDASIVKGAGVGMVEDMSSTFESTQRAMKPVVDAEGVVMATYVINTWDLPDFQRNTEYEMVYAGADGKSLIVKAFERGLVDDEYYEFLINWQKNPRDESWVTDAWS